MSRRDRIHPIVWAFALAIAFGAMASITVSNFRECRAAGGSLRLCAWHLIR